WSAAGLIYYSSFNPSKTTTPEKYYQQINEMHRKLEQQLPALVSRKEPIIPHDNAWLGVTEPALQKTNELTYETLPHPPYSPDLLHACFHFFEHLDNFLREKCFTKHDDAKNASNEFTASGTPEFNAAGVNRFASRWRKC
ncbi:hypothetical protein Angca_003249, partial [Angiostrongylus cantonensis]